MPAKPRRAKTKAAPKKKRVGAEAELNADNFEALYAALLADTKRKRGNVACLECERCVGCIGSTFCKQSENLIRCHFCVRCALCSDSAHCRASRALVGCQHCVACEDCSASSYLVRCASLANCSYCFGCVGLTGCDFYILNTPYERADYFAITQKLMRALKL